MTSKVETKIEKCDDCQGLGEIVKELQEQQASTLTCLEPCACGQPLPSQVAVAEMMDQLRTVLFPMHFGDAELNTKRFTADLMSRLSHLRPQIQEQIHLHLS